MGKTARIASAAALVWLAIGAECAQAADQLAKPLGSQLAASAAAAPANAPSSGQFIATQADSTIASLAQRWAVQEKIPMEWQADHDFQLLSAQKLNESAGLAQAKDWGDAMTRVFRALSASRPYLAGFYSCCIHRDGKALTVVRSVEQPDCDGVVRGQNYRPGHDE